MTRHVMIAVLLLLGCEKTATIEPKPGPASCETYLHHADEITHTVHNGPMNVLATMGREGDGEWRCVSSDPPELCAKLEQICKKPR